MTITEILDAVRDHRAALRSMFGPNATSSDRELMNQLTRDFHRALLAHLEVTS